MVDNNENKTTVDVLEDNSTDNLSNVSFDEFKKSKEYRKSFVAQINDENKDSQEEVIVSRLSMLSQEELDEIEKDKKRVNIYKRNQIIKHWVLFGVMVLVSALFIFPIIIILYNSFKSNGSITTDFFGFPNSKTFVGFDNYGKGFTFGEYPFYLSFLYSLIITVTSVILILLCTSMAAWFISRVNNIFCKIIYYLCIFSMVVPFQMVMFTLSKTADKLHLNNPFTICITYLGFGAGMAIFMFAGFVKSIPLEIEEAAAIDGCNPIQTFFLVVAPICKPMYLSVAILEIMWIWNDFLLPYLTLDMTKYRTLPIHIQYLQGSYGRVDMGATMALITLCLLPVIIIYILFQKHIIKGVVDGAVK